MVRYLIFFPSANFAIRWLISLMIGITNMLSLRGKIPINTIVALGAFRRQTSRIALIPRVMSLILGSSLPCVELFPTLLAPASRTMILGLTLSNSPLLRRHSMFWVLSPPQPKLAAFQPKKFSCQFSRKYLNCSSLVPQRLVGGFRFAHCHLNRPHNRGSVHEE